MQRSPDLIAPAASEYVEMPSGLILPDHLAEEIARSSQFPTAVDLFAGCGGATCGMIQAGFHVMAAVDFDAQAAITYMMNCGSYPCQFVFVEDADKRRLEKALSKSYRKPGKKPGAEQLELSTTSGSGWISSLDPRPPGCGVFFLGDVRKISGREILRSIGLQRGELDCVVGGPPCQGFSRAGKQNVMDPRNSLIFEFARLVCEMNPRTIVMENVPGLVDMTTPEGLPVIDAFCRVLQDGGFAGLDAMKKAMRQQGMLGLVRGKVDRKKKRARR
jgi:DNA (cytosine-5)-methyltransferase 1